MHLFHFKINQPVHLFLTTCVKEQYLLFVFLTQFHFSFWHHFKKERTSFAKCWVGIRLNCLGKAKIRGILEQNERGNRGRERGGRSENELRNHGKPQDIWVLFYVKLTIWKGPDHNCEWSLFIKYHSCYYVDSNLSLPGEETRNQIQGWQRRTAWPGFVTMKLFRQHFLADFFIKSVRKNQSGIISNFVPWLVGELRYYSVVDIL